MTGLDSSQLQVIVNDIDVDKAECVVPTDKDMIIDNIQRHHGSTNVFNGALKQQLLLKPVSLKVCDTQTTYETSRACLDPSGVEARASETVLALMGDNILSKVDGTVVPTASIFGKGKFVAIYFR